MLQKQCVRGPCIIRQTSLKSGFFTPPMSSNMAQRSAFAQSSRCEPGGFRWRWLLCAHLRQKCAKSVGGPGLSRGTSDRNTGKVSEAQDFRGVPPTETREKCRRSSPANVHQVSQQPGIPNLRPQELTKAKY